MREKLRRIGRESRHNVISRRDNLILIPDRAPAIPEEDASAAPDATADSAVATPDSEGGVDEQLTAKILAGRDVSASTFQREFELDDVLDYVKTGIASIIEDEVTQRFVSEELKVMFNDDNDTLGHPPLSGENVQLNIASKLKNLHELIKQLIVLESAGLMHP